MAEHDGSRWYFPVYEGLLDGKHCQQMGPGVWLYLWLLSRAHVARDEGRLVYSHQDAARALGVSDKTVRLWFERLQKDGYVHTRARHPYHLEVEVSNWRPVAEWLEARTEAERIILTGGADGRAQGPAPTGEERTVSSYRSETENGKEIGKENGKENGKELPLSHISIRLLGYEYPPATQEGATSAPVCLKNAFAWLLELQRNAKNSSATLAGIYSLIFGEEAPAYGLLGRAARVVGGAGRLVELMWQLATKPPSGDILGYLMKGKREGSAPHGAHYERGKKEPAAWGDGAAILAANRAALGTTEHTDHTEGERK